MKSDTSLINMGILRHDLKRYGWTGLAYFLTLLMVVPLQLVMRYFRPEEIKVHYTAHTYLQVFQFNYSLALTALFLVVPVLTGLLLFRYLQSGPAADMEHSLPVTRETLYNTHLLAGCILLFIPVVCTGLISWALVYGLGIDFVQNQHIMTWLTIMLLGNLLFFISAAAIGMFTGLTALQGLLTYILLLVPTGLTFLLLDNLGIYLYGFTHDFYMFDLNKFSPLLRLQTSDVSLPNSEIILYLSISLALYFTGRYLYRQRHIEMAGDAITFRILRPVFKYSVTFCTMLLIGNYFYHSQQTMIWTYFGYLFGAVISYLLIEILLNKSLHIFDGPRFKGFGIYSLVVIGLITLLHADVLAYENKLPEINQVENIYMGYSFHPLLYQDDPRVGQRNVWLPIFKDRENIVHIIDLHREIINHRGDGRIVLASAYNPERERIYLAYQLKNGKRLYRYYQIDTSFYQKQLKPIYESQEYKNNKYEVLRVNPSDIKLVDVGCHEGNKYVSIADPQMIQEAMSALRNDIYAQTFEETKSPATPWGYIEIILPEEEYEINSGTTRPESVFGYPYYIISLSWQKSYVNFEDWLKSAGLYDKARLSPGDDVIHAILEYIPEGLNEHDYQIAKRTRDYIEDEPGQLKVSAADELEICLRNYQEQYTSGPVYKISFQLKNGNLIVGLLTPATVPGFVKQHFAR